MHVRTRLESQFAPGCVEGGTAYADGSGMMSSSTCEYCFCLKGRQSCVKPRCRTPIGKEGCVPRYRPMICCPVYYDCGSFDQFGFPPLWQFYCILADPYWALIPHSAKMAICRQLTANLVHIDAPSTANATSGADDLGGSDNCDCSWYPAAGR